MSASSAGEFAIVGSMMAHASSAHGVVIVGSTMVHARRVCIIV